MGNNNFTSSYQECVGCTTLRWGCCWSSPTIEKVVPHTFHWWVLWMWLSLFLSTLWLSPCSVVIKVSSSLFSASFSTPCSLAAPPSCFLCGRSMQSSSLYCPIQTREKVALCQPLLWLSFTCSPSLTGESVPSTATTQLATWWHNSCWWHCSHWWWSSHSYLLLPRYPLFWEALSPKYDFRPFSFFFLLLPQTLLDKCCRPRTNCSYLWGWIYGESLSPATEVWRRMLFWTWPRGVCHPVLFYQRCYSIDCKEVGDFDLECSYSS